MARATAKPVPAPRGREHLRAMQLVSSYPNLAVTELQARYGSVFAFGVGPLRFIWLAGAEANRFVLEEAAPHFALGPAYGFLRTIGGDAALITSDEPEHLRRRRLVQPAFHRARLERAVALTEKRFQAQFSSWEGRTVDLYAQMQRCVLGTLCEVLVGGETVARAPELVRHVAQMMRFANLPFAAQLFKVPLPGIPWGRFVAARSRADRLLYREITRRRREGNPGDDVLSLLLAATDEAGRGLSDKEVRDQTISLVSAGFDTTSAAFCWTVYELLRQPNLLTRLRSDLGEVPAPLTLAALQRSPFLERTIKEALRLYPPAPAGLRQATRELEFAGYRIPKGHLVAFSIYATHRESAYYRDPLRFNPERWNPESADADAPPPYAYLPFGSGARYCIGAGLATSILKVGLITLLRTYELTPAWHGPVTETGNTVHPKGGLPVYLARANA